MRLSAVCLRCVLSGCSEWSCPSTQGVPPLARVLEILQRSPYPNAKVSGLDAEAAGVDAQASENEGACKVANVCQVPGRNRTGYTATVHGVVD